MRIYITVCFEKKVVYCWFYSLFCTQRIRLFLLYFIFIFFTCFLYQKIYYIFFFRWPFFFLGVKETRRCCCLVLCVSNTSSQSIKFRMNQFLVVCYFQILWCFCFCFFFYFLALKMYFCFMPHTREYEQQHCRCYAARSHAYLTLLMAVCLICITSQRRCHRHRAVQLLYLYLTENYLSFAIDLRKKKKLEEEIIEMKYEIKQNKIKINNPSENSFFSICFMYLYNVQFIVRVNSFINII